MRRCPASAIAAAGGAAFVARSPRGRRLRMGRPRLSAAACLGLPGFRLARGRRPRRRSCCAPSRRRTGAGGSPPTRQVDPQFLEMLVAYEDKRFWDHDGVDFLALAPRRRPVRRQRPHRLGRLDAVDAARAADRAARKPHVRRQDPSDLARRPDRAAADQARDPRALPDAGALWRQSRRHPRRLARLFRQGAEAADAVGGGPARGAAAIARTRRPDRNLAGSACRARPRAWPHGKRRPDRRARGRARRCSKRCRQAPRACPRSPPTLRAPRCATRRPRRAIS